MPVPIAAKAGVIAISVAVAAAIAVYESPELRRMAEDLRRRIAIALHSLGDGINPNQPRFNRPEDAEGFVQSRGVMGADLGVDADDETRRRQREELMYWNAVLAEKKEKEREAAAEAQPASAHGSTFDDFLQQDKSGERGMYVFNTGADVHGDTDGLVRRRAPEGVRGLSASLYADPFGDEHGIDLEDHPVMEANILAPGRDEESDIYNATERADPTAASATLSPRPVPDVLFDFDAAPRHAVPSDPLLERELGPDEYMTAGQDEEDHHQDAYASIQAWAAQNSNPGFYSPLPVSPPAPLSEPEIVSEGALTPADSASVAGSGEDVDHDAASSRAGENGRFYDVMSDEEDSMPTPSSWTEVGSVVSESDDAAHA